MSTLKNKKYNKFLEEILCILLILAASLIPWIEFINSNYKEIDEIFNDNFFNLISLYFLTIILIYFFIKVLFKKKTKAYYISLIGISIWIFFQFNLLKSILNNLFSKTSLWHYSSEISLFIVLTLIITLTIILGKNKNWRSFVLFFLLFNFIYSSIIVFPKLEILKFDNNRVNSKKFVSSQNSSNNKDKPNIYFFLIDSLKPLNEFENFYDLKLKAFRNFYQKNDYTYYENTTNLYMWTEPVATSMFYLEESIYEPDTNNLNTDNNVVKHWSDLYLNKKLKPNIDQVFPTFLKNEYTPKLLADLIELGYDFKWVGNYIQNCSQTNYKYCLKNQKKKYVDIYTLQAFLNKSPIIQILDNLIQLKIVNNFFDIKILHSDAIFELNKFVLSNKNRMNDINSTFFFIHDMETHDPYFVDSNCDNKRLPGKYNLEGYKNSYLCVVKKITNVIETLDKFDPNSLVIFQADHSWIMSDKSEEKYGKRNSIFNLIKNNVICDISFPDNPNTFHITDYLMNCLKT